MHPQLTHNYSKIISRRTQWMPLVTPHKVQVPHLPKNLPRNMDATIMPAYFPEG